MSSWSKVLVGCAVAAFLLVLLLGAGGFMAWKYYIKPAISKVTQMPPALKTPAVLQGAGFVTQSVFVQDSRLGVVSDIRLAQLDGRPGTDVGVAGDSCALFVDKAGNVKSHTQFAGEPNHVDFVDVERDGVCEYMGRGSWSTKATLMDHRGRVVWTYGGSSGVNDMAAGDVNGDGVLEFAVGFNGSGGVHLLVAKGKNLWRERDANVWQVWITDTNGDRRGEIVHSNAGGEMTIRDSTGKVAQTLEPPSYLSSFSLCNWPTKSGAAYPLYCQENAVRLLDYHGKALAVFRAPHSGMLGNARGTLAKLKPNQPEYLAVVVTLRQFRRAILYIYAKSGALVYQEVLPEDCGAIAAMPLDNSGLDTILVGGEGKVLAYKP